MKLLFHPIPGMEFAYVTGRRRFAMKHLLSLIILILALAGCSAGDDSAGDQNYVSSNNSNNLNSVNNTTGGNVNIGGVQDIGLFREIIEAGDIPAPSTLTANGFFSEHYLEYPFGECDERLCLNGMIGRGRSLLSNDYMNALQVVLKSYVDPSDYERPPTDFIAVIDVSGSMYSDEKIQYAKQGLHLLVDALKADDRLSVIAYSDWASEVLTLTFADSADARDRMHAAVSSLYPTGSTNIYDGLTQAFDTARESGSEDRYARIVLLSDGVPTSGITDEDAILSLARESTSDKVQLTSIGVGYDVNYELMQDLAMAGGNFYFVEDGAALTEIFVQELDFFAFPIARDITISLNAGASFYAGDAVGFDQWIPSGTGGSAYIPAVYAASRVSSSTEDPHTRRGGGSALFVRLVAQNSARDLSGMVLTMTYTDPEDELPVTQDVLVDELAGGDGIVPVDAYYSQEVMQKSFLMLNLYLALREVCQRAVNGDYEGARELLVSAIDHASAVNDQLADEDIENDIALMDRLLLNLGYTYGDDYYCAGDNCYYDDTYYSDETVNYGCSTSQGPSGALPLLIGLVLGFVALRRRRRS